MEKLADLIPANKRHILDDIQQHLMKLMSGTLPRSPPTSWKGYRFLPGFSSETTKYAYENYEFDKDSVCIVTHPKTGTNWCSEIVRQILYGHDEELDILSKSLPPNLILLETGSAEKYQLFEHIPLPRRLFLSHLPEELVNLEKIKKSNGKVIVVLRNPKDQAVSWFNMVHSMPGEIPLKSFSPDWAVFLSDYMQGKHPTISKEGEWYPDHILGWYKHKDDPNVLFVYFEDMKRDLKKEICRIAEFVDVQLGDRRLDMIAEATTFSNMKKKVESQSDTFSKLRSNINIMRKGQVGGWKDVFTVAQSELMDKIFEEKLGHTDIKFTYQL